MFNSFNTDCLGMTGADIGSLETRANRALYAGCDLLIIANQTRSNLYGVLNHITITPESTTRIAAFKNKIKRNPDTIVPTRLSQTQTLLDSRNPTQTV